MDAERPLRVGAGLAIIGATIVAAPMSPLLAGLGGAAALLLCGQEFASRRNAKKRESADKAREQRAEEAQRRMEGWQYETTEVIASLKDAMRGAGQAADARVQAVVEEVAERVAPHVAIVSPAEGERVDARQSITGTVRPGGADNVQVFVLSRDNQWWRKRAKVDAGTWRVDDCAFGTADAPSGTGYTLVAVLGADTRGAEALREPRPGVAESARVRVFRK